MKNKGSAKRILAAARGALQSPGGAVLLVLFMACALPLRTWGDIARPLYIGNIQPVLDQNGHALVGSSEITSANQRARVEIRVAADGVIRPPSATGAAHPGNPLLSPDSIGGMGMNAAEPNSGLFCMVFPARPATGTRIFARVYNAPTVAEASFYADSEIVAAPSLGTSLVLNFGAARPLDTGDVDADGLNNAWEKALGINDRATADYDGDGMPDFQEMLAGTAPDDGTSLLAFLSVRPEAGAGVAQVDPTWMRPIRVKWQAVPGKKYQLETVASLLGTPVFQPVGEVVIAGAGQYELDTLVQVPADAPLGVLRIQLVTQ